MPHPPPHQRHHNQVQRQHQEQQQQQQRPLSFLPSAREEIIQAKLEDNNQDGSSRRNIVGRSKTFDRPSYHANRQHVVGRSNSVPHEHGLPSPSGLHSPADTATASFPLNDIDYESSPAAVAQELSNLQAIRRMSMNVDSAGDPDLPTFGVPPSSPTGSEGEDDASRLFWVPARLHPELAPTEFKTFLDKKVESIKRRSGEYSLSPDGLARQGSGGGLQRKKSMLSRQINTEGRSADGYQDGAERLERKRSASNHSGSQRGMSNLHALEEMVNDPTRAIQRLSLDTNQDKDPSILDEDMPILPVAPGGNSLRRSTRTTYRRGSLRKGERVPPSRRAAKTVESDVEDVASPISAGSEPSQGLYRVQTEPTPALERVPEKSAENFSRPNRGNRRVGSPPPSASNVSFDSILQNKKQTQAPAPAPPPDRVDSKSPPSVPPLPILPPTTSREPQKFVSQIASNGRSTARVPSIVETPPQHEDSRAILQQSYRADLSNELKSLQPQMPRTGKRQPRPQGDKPEQTLQHMASHPSPLPGNSTRTDSLSFIPTLTEDKRADSKKEGSKKSGWSWGSLLGSEEKEKEKRKEEEAKEAKEASKRSKLKLGKSNDTTRLDVLQTTMEGNRGRESLVLDRGDVKLDEERRKESSRKSSESKKEKESGLFSSLFGGGKKKPDRESLGKKAVRALSPEPPRPALKPDIDYNWTRFSILEERAIYRMAHIKLANPRRALYSQVLLSNFMYSYLAKVQQMHPQIQIPQTAAAKAQQRAQQQKQQKTDQPEEFAQYQRYQEVSQHCRPC